MAPGGVEAIRTTGPIFIFREEGVSSNKILIQVAAYDTVQQMTILPIQ